MIRTPFSASLNNLINSEVGEKDIMTTVCYDSSKRFYLVIALIAIIPRFLFIFFFPETAGDSKLYETTAENILSGCGVSLSPVGSGECVPHFGGNQGPGYPAFIAFFWWISGHSDLIVRLAQGTFYVVALVYMVDAIRLYTSSLKLALLTGLVLALSPLQIAWPRYLLTETLALAGTLWLFAELLRSLHVSKLRIAPIAIAMIATTFIRYDGVLLAIPVAATGFIIHRPIDAIRRGLVIALILGFPWMGWMIRNIEVNLESVLIPPIASFDKATKGYSSWMKTWQVNQYQTQATLWPVATKSYHAIRVDESAYRTENEKKKVHILLDQLKEYSGQPFPSQIDDQFFLLAEKRIKAEPLIYFLFNPVKRIWALWSNIYDSFAWPFSLDLSPQDRIDITKGGVEEKLLLLKKHPIQTIGKIFVNGWLLFLYFLFIISNWIVYKNKMPQCRYVLILALSFAMARSVLSGYLNVIETRYIIMQLASMEIVVGMVVAHQLLRYKNNLNI
jgi:hypothetical protein